MHGSNAHLMVLSILNSRIIFVIILDIDGIQPFLSSIIITCDKLWPVLFLSVSSMTCRFNLYCVRLVFHFICIANGTVDLNTARHYEDYVSQNSSLHNKYIQYTAFLEAT